MSLFTQIRFFGIVFVCLRIRQRATADWNMKSLKKQCSQIKKKVLTRYYLAKTF